MNRHPLVRVFDTIVNDHVVCELLNEFRGYETDQPLVFTMHIPEDYQKENHAPFVRVSEIILQNTFFNDGDSNHYRFLFSVETFGTTINEVYQINEQIIKRIESKNGKCYERQINQSNDIDLYYEMLKFNIIYNEKEQ